MFIRCVNGWKAYPEGDKYYEDEKSKRGQPNEIAIKSLPLELEKVLHPSGIFEFKNGGIVLDAGCLWGEHRLSASNVKNREPCVGHPRKTNSEELRPFPFICKNSDHQVGRLEMGNSPRGVCLMYRRAAVTIKVAP